MEKHKKLVELLLAQTMSAQLDWRETGSDSVFQVSLTNNSVQIEYGTGENNNDITISLINSNGEVVDSFDDTDLDRQGEGGGYFHKMITLYRLARRTALGSEKILDEVLGELEKRPRSV